MYLAMALEFLGFFKNFAHLKGAERGKFLSLSQTHFLHIYLRRLDAPARARHNQVAFQTARLDEIDRLPDEPRESIRDRLLRRFPNICFGYTISGPADAPTEHVTTITHPFPWPNSPVRGIGIAKAARMTLLWEWYLQSEGKKAEAAHEEEKAFRRAYGKKNGAKNTHRKREDF